MSFLGKIFKKKVNRKEISKLNEGEKRVELKENLEKAKHKLNLELKKFDFEDEKRLEKEKGLEEAESLGISPSLYNRDWIDIEITIMSPYSELIRIKQMIKPFADELGWDIKSGNFKEKSDIERVNVTILPKINGKISPKEFLTQKDKIIGLSYAIFRDLVYNGDNKNASENFTQKFTVNVFRKDGTLKPNKEDWKVKRDIGFLSLSYPLIMRVDLEKQNKKLAIDIFEKTIEDDLKKLFKPQKSVSKKSKKDLENEKKLRESQEDFDLVKNLKDAFGFDFL